MTKRHVGELAEMMLTLRPRVVHTLDKHSGKMVAKIIWLEDHEIHKLIPAKKLPVTRSGWIN